MTWKIFGHDGAVNYLKRQCEPGNMRHAYLITGPEGIGRLTLAKAFVKALNCQNPPAKHDFCNTCQACRQIEAEVWPDLTILRPTENARDIKIDQVRQMQQSLALAPYQSQWRVVIIPDFQNATVAASNALLKSLEEPPARAIIILTADARENLLETIASRCGILRLRPMSVGAVARVLQSELNLDEDDAKMIAHLAGGRVGTAIHFAQNPDLLEQYHDTLVQLHEVLPETKRARLQYAEGVSKRKGSQRENISTLLSVWLTFWRDVMIAHSGADLPIVNLAQRDVVKTVASQLSLPQIESILKAHEKGLEQIDANVNSRLVLENILLNIPRLKV
ncbi:MAG TPA: DNA polymerase III subunit delta' [Anaerolineaceae bacterium]|nr:DNA polymerase III subunit delta' [Anaerolineaceae bacterium]